MDEEQCELRLTKRSFVMLAMEDLKSQQQYVLEKPERPHTCGLADPEILHCCLHGLPRHQWRCAAAATWGSAHRASTPFRRSGPECRRPEAQCGKAKHRSNTAR